MGCRNECFRIVTSRFTKHALEGKGCTRVLKENDLSGWVLVHKVLVKEMGCRLVFPHAKNPTTNSGGQAEIIAVEAVAQNGPYGLPGIAVNVLFLHQFSVGRSSRKPRQTKRGRHVFAWPRSAIQFKSVPITGQSGKVVKTHAQDTGQSRQGVHSGQVEDNAKQPRPCRACGSEVKSPPQFIIWPKLARNCYAIMATAFLDIQNRAKIGIAVGTELARCLPLKKGLKNAVLN